jgi:hypothetical protein
MDEGRLFGRALAAIRKSQPISTWNVYADAIAKDRRESQKELATAKPDRRWFTALDALRGRGFIKLPLTLPGEVVADIRAHFDANPVHRGPHIYSFDGRPRRLEQIRRDYSMAGYNYGQALAAPHLLDTLNDPRLIDLIEEFMGCVPTLYSLNGWWSFPARRPELIHSQYFHRDIDDWRFLALFLYLTDVDHAGGPHQVILESQTVEGTRNLVAKAKAAGRDVNGFDPEDSFVSSAGEQFSKNCERLFGENTVDATGPAGTMFLVNTMALHRGLMPIYSPRLIVCARYGFGPCVNSVDLEHGPVARRLRANLAYRHAAQQVHQSTASRLRSRTHWILTAQGKSIAVV